jgi:hypothetical protein
LEALLKKECSNQEFPKTETEYAEYYEVPEECLKKEEL